MRTPFKITFCVVLSSMLLLVVFAVTQEPKQSGMNIPAYNPSQESTFSGTIVEVKNYQCPVLGTPGAHIVVKGITDTVEVHLAPVAFLTRYEIVFNPGDKVSVTGVKFNYQGKPAMIAGAVVDGQNTYLFRDIKGRPQW